MHGLPEMQPTCPHCGSDDYALAEERTEYFDVAWVDGVPTVTGHRRVEAEDRRVFCTSCGAYFEVPAALDTSEA